MSLLANYFTLVLDTTGPGSPTISFPGAFITDQLVTVNISTSDADKTGYQMLIWGDVDETFETNIKSTEGTSSWISYASTKQIKMSSSDGSKTIYLKIRDDVLNVSSQASATTSLDTTLPVANVVTGPDVTKISKVATKDTATFTWKADSKIVAYEVRVVPAVDSPHDAGSLIGTINGSTNTSGSTTINADTNTTTKITGADLELASSGDGAKIIKVFIKDEAGNWSV